MPGTSAADWLAVACLAVATVAAGCRTPAPLPASLAPAPPGIPDVLREAMAPAFPPPLVPADNPLTREKVELGRHLFHDKRLSGNRTQSCGSCHRQELAFTDGLPQAIGSTGELHSRSAMSLANVAYSPALTWADPGIETLEEQAPVPMFQRHPVELGLHGMRDVVLERLRAELRYVAMFRSAFPDDEGDPIRFDNVIRALASFQRILISGDSPYDRLVYQGEQDAMSQEAWRGMQLFFSDRLACGTCHHGPNFSGPIRFRPPHRSRAAAGLGEPEAEFRNTGLHDVDGRGGYPPSDTGLLQVTGRPQDMGRFRVPTLRNIALTAPYMHDGSVPTLDAVLDHYAAGGRAGGRSPYRDPLMRGFRLSASERRELLAFLHSLTDRRFVTDPALADPWR